MKKNLFFLFAVCLLATVQSQAQVAINTDSSNADPSAILDLKSSNKGLLLPRMTDISTNPVLNPKAGLVVYDSATYKTWLYNGYNWIPQTPFNLPFSGSYSSVTTPLVIENHGGHAFSGLSYGPFTSAGYFYGDSGALSLQTFGPLQILNNGEGAGKILTSDASGIATWQNPSGTLTLPYTGSYSATGDAFTINKTNSGNAIHLTINADDSRGIYVENTNTSTTATRASINSVTQGNGPAIAATANGTGNASSFTVNNANSYSNAIYATSNAGGNTIFATNTGTGSAAYFTTNNSANTNFALNVESQGSEAAIFGIGRGTGGGGDFRINNTANTSPALTASTDGSGSTVYFSNYGTGAAFTAQQANASNDVARFVSGQNYVARIDKIGKGYFDGGTQTGGADLAEAFAVEGNRNNYEPGDVLIVSTEADRTVAKSTNAYSTLVVGVYATKPGMLLTERTGAESQSDLVPMGVIGVIPTKVCNEGGAIHRGDLLVTSSQQGCAMKGTDNKLKIGTVIGKALEDFTGNGTGLIKVMVSIK